MQEPWPIVALMRVLTLYPGDRQELNLAGLYLDDLPTEGGHPFIYANFLASLDGRIALRNSDGRKGVPEAIANDRDWRLYSELLVQADAVLTTGHHAKALAAGEQTDMMTIAHERYPDLRDIRRSRGLSEHPACIVVTSRLDFPAAALKEAHPGAILAISPPMDAAKTRAAHKAGVETVMVGSGSQVAGRDVLRVLNERGLRRVYMVGGPRLFHGLLADGIVHRLYLTTACRLLGGEEDVETPVRGPAFPLPPEARLRGLALDLDGQPQQIFASYDLSPY